MKSLIVIGNGGHSQVIQDIAKANDIKIVAVLDDVYDERHDDGMIKGPLSLVEEILVLYPHSMIVIAIGANHMRKGLVERLSVDEVRYGALIHPSAVIGTDVTIGAGTVVMANSTVNARAEIGKHAIINTGAIVEHDCHVGDFAHLSPQAAMAGASHVDEGSHLGIGSVLIPKIRVGAWTTVGAGAVVIKNIPQKCKAVGVPARLLQSDVDW